MVCFLITHLLYIAALFSKAALSIYDIAFFAALIVIAAAFFSLRGVRFKKLHPAVYVYAVVLCAMAARSLSVSFSSQVSETFAVIIALGGVLFLISDVLLAIESFGGRLAKTVGMLSTFTYYASQILIALSVAM
jgi:uncharacterized membrane protein YhhN